MKRMQMGAAILALGGLAALPACSMMGMNRSNTQTSAASSMARPALSPDMVREVQSSLQQQGLYKGNIDGVWGSETQAALRSYQGAHNLTADGQLDQPTLKSLNLASNGTADSSAMAPGSPPAPMSPSPSQSPAISSGSPTMTTPPATTNQ